MAHTRGRTVAWLFVVALTLNSAASVCALWGGSALELMPCCATLANASPHNSIEPCCGAANQRGQAVPVNAPLHASAAPDSRLATFVHDVWTARAGYWRSDRSPARPGIPPDTHLLLSVFLI